jgi:hypothetical protein
MLAVPRRPSAGTIAWGSVALVPLFALIPAQGAVQVGGILCWTGLCTACVLADRMLLWATLCLGMLGGISLSYWSQVGIADGNFGIRESLAFAFIVAAFVTAGTGVLAVVRSAAAAPRAAA